jgi:hypothetical protein
MAAIYDKTLKRKDFSGIVSKDNEKAIEVKKGPDAADAAGATKADKAKAKSEADQANDPKAGAGAQTLFSLHSVLQHSQQIPAKSKTSCPATPMR